MKREIAKKWVRALRSKKYRQATGVLKIKNKNGRVSHCCLGVLCELYQQERTKSKQTLMQTKNYSAHDFDGVLPRASRVFEFAGSTVALPLQVKLWAGLADDCGEFRGDFMLEHNQKCMHSLAELNDNGARFSTIADVIEAHVTRI